MTETTATELLSELLKNPEDYRTRLLDLTAATEKLEAETAVSVNEREAMERDRAAQKAEFDELRRQRDEIRLETVRLQGRQRALAAEQEKLADERKALEQAKVEIDQQDDTARRHLIALRTQVAAASKDHKLASLAREQAELELVEKHEVAEQIKAMKADLTAMRKDLDAAAKWLRSLPRVTEE